jgi:hypothetical protein
VYLLGLTVLHQFKSIYYLTETSHHSSIEPGIIFVSRIEGKIEIPRDNPHPRTGVTDRLQFLTFL